MANIAGHFYIAIIGTILSCRFTESEYHLGACPSISSHTPFNITDLEGTWYEVKKIDDINESNARRCTQINVNTVKNSKGKVLSR